MEDAYGFKKYIPQYIPSLRKKKINNGWYDFYKLPSLRFYGSAEDHNQELINSLLERPGEKGEWGLLEEANKSKSRPNQRGLDMVQHVGGVKCL